MKTQTEKTLMQMKLLQKQEQASLPQNDMSENVRLFGSVALAVANDFYPSILLSEAAEVIDVSDNFRSCHGKAVNRTILIDSMSVEDFSRLTEFCAGTQKVSREHAYLKFNTLMLDLKLYKYRIGLCKKLRCSASHITVMYLAENNKDLEFLDILSGRYCPKEFLNVLKYNSPHSKSNFLSAVLTLFDPLDEFDVHEAKVFLSSIAAKLSKSGMHITSSIKINDAASAVRDHGMGLRPGPYAVIFTSLLSVLDIASENREINISFHSGEGTFEVEMCAVSSAADKFIGSITDIMSLSAYISGSGIYLSLAAACAADAEMYLRADRNGDKLRFIFGIFTDPFPILEFKYRDPEERVDKMLGAVLDILASPEFNAQVEEAQAEE